MAPIRIAKVGKMFLLAALATTAAPAAEIAKNIDCRPMLTLMAVEREAADRPREQAQRRDEQKPRPPRRCVTLASV